MPTLVPTGVTTIKIQGRYEGKELLLITNTTSNEVIYNFTSNELGGTVKYKTHGADTDFPKYLQITDTVTTLTLNKDTSLQSSTDDVQLFVESEFITLPNFIQLSQQYRGANHLSRIHVCGIERAK